MDAVHCGVMTLDQQQKMVTLARSLIGRPYKYGATPEEAPNCFDCSSFTQYLFKQAGIDIPRSSILQAADPNGTEIVPTADFGNLEPGDLLFMRGTRGFYRDWMFPGREIYIGHVVLYIGDGKIIHPRESKHSVAEQDLLDLVRDPKFSVVLVKRH